MRVTADDDFISLKKLVALKQTSRKTENNR
jgi:hypothetical protein